MALTSRLVRMLRRNKVLNLHRAVFSFPRYPAAPMSLRKRLSMRRVQVMKRSGRYQKYFPRQEDLSTLRLVMLWNRQVRRRKLSPDPAPAGRHRRFAPVGDRDVAGH